MATLFICLDAADTKTLRDQHRAAHFAYIESIMDQVLVAGPLDAQRESAPAGSLFVYATDDPTTAEGLLHNDPYFTAGIYGSVKSRHLLPAAGTWLGGGIWQEGVPGKPERKET